MRGRWTTVWAFIVITVVTLGASQARAATRECATLGGADLFLPTGIGLVTGIPAFMNRNGSFELAGGVGSPSPDQLRPRTRPELNIDGSIDSNFGGWGYETRWSTQEIDVCDYMYHQFSLAGRFPLMRGERSELRLAAGAHVVLASVGGGIGPALSLIHDWQHSWFLLTSRLSYYPSYAGAHPGGLVTSHPVMGRVRAAIPSDFPIQFTGTVRGGLNRLVIPPGAVYGPGAIHPNVAVLLGVRFQSVRNVR